jgi:uncharacterized protein (DUF486 family)
MYTILLLALSNSFITMAGQLKTIQEVITLVAFCVFSVLYPREPLKWNYLVGFGMMVRAMFIIFKEWQPKESVISQLLMERRKRERQIVVPMTIDP